MLGELHIRVAAGFGGRSRPGRGSWCFEVVLCCFRWGLASHWGMSWRITKVFLDLRKISWKVYLEDLPAGKEVAFELSLESTIDFFVSEGDFFESVFLASIFLSISCFAMFGFNKALMEGCSVRWSLGMYPLGKETARILGKTDCWKWKHTISISIETCRRFSLCLILFHRLFRKFLCLFVHI